MFTENAHDDEWAERVQEFAKVGAWTYAVDTGQSWWSKTVYDLYEIPYDSPKPPPLSEHFPPEKVKALEQAIQTAALQDSEWCIESPFVSAKGRVSHVVSTGYSKAVGGARITFGCFQDITQLHAARSAASANETFLESIVNNIPHMVFVKEAQELRFVRINRAGEQLLGLSAANLIGKNDYDFFPREQADHFVVSDRLAMQRREVIDIPKEVISTKVGDRVVHTKKITIVDANGAPAYLLGISHDITESLEQTRVIAEQRTALFQASRLSALGEMAGGIAHEINNPLAIIGMASEQIKVAIATSPQDLELINKLSDKIDRTVVRIAGIVRALRDFSRDGTTDPFEVTSVDSLVAGTLALCGEKFKFSSIEVVLRIDSSLRVRCQPARVSQVLINLLSNAFDALESSDVESKCVLVTAETADDDRFVQITVEDNGVGISPGIADRIMQPFFTTKPIGKGTGLGLSISRGICEAQGGSLAMVPKTVGAAFVVMLPLGRTERVDAT
jgi:PAS domain S-box-containing protein